MIPSRLLRPRLRFVNATNLPSSVGIGPVNSFLSTKHPAIESQECVRGDPCIEMGELSHSFKFIVKQENLQRSSSFKLVNSPMSVVKDPCKLFSSVHVVKRQEESRAKGFVRFKPFAFYVLPGILYHIPNAMPVTRPFAQDTPCHPSHS